MGCVFASGLLRSPFWDGVRAVRSSWLCAVRCAAGPGGWRQLLRNRGLAAYGWMVCATL